MIILKSLDVFRMILKKEIFKMFIIFINLFIKDYKQSCTKIKL